MSNIKLLRDNKPIASDAAISDSFRKYRTAQIILELKMARSGTRINGLVDVAVPLIDAIIEHLGGNVANNQDK